MTEERLVLAELLEKAGEGDFLRAVAEAVLQLLMETAPTKVRNWCAADVETIRRNSALGRCGSVPSRGRRFVDVRRMH